MDNFVNVSAVMTDTTATTLDFGTAVSNPRSTLQTLMDSGQYCTPDREAEAITQREQQWREVLRPSNALEDWLVRRVAIESAAIDRYDALALAHRDAMRYRAVVSWQEDRKLAVAELAMQLPSQPWRTVQRLKQTRQGCDWLIARWNALATRIANRGWDENARNRALDLLGVPLEERLDAPDVEPPLRDAASIRVVVAELAAYRDTVLAARDGHEQYEAAHGAGHESAIVRQLRQLAARAQHRLAWALGLLRGQPDRPRRAAAPARPDKASLPPAPEPTPAGPSPGGLPISSPASAEVPLAATPAPRQPSAERVAPTQPTLCVPSRPDGDDLIDELLSQRQRQRRRRRR